MRIAITGGIGSGKSYVCRLLAERGIEVYDCDAAAKRLMHNDAKLQSELTALIGPGTYNAEGQLNKPMVAQFLLSNEANKQAVNAIVHPAVARDFEASGQQWLESAILFESRFETQVKFDHIVCVIAPTEIRIDRICRRDSISRSQALQWISNQMEQEQKAARSQFVIINDGQQDLNKQIDRILEKIYDKLK